MKIKIREIKMNLPNKGQYSFLFFREYHFIFYIRKQIKLEFVGILKTVLMIINYHTYV